MVRLSAHRQNIFADLGNQSEKLKICQSTFERVSGETFAWLWLGFSDPSNACQHLAAKSLGNICNSMVAAQVNGIVSRSLLIKR
jgi:hypothetical protein